MDARKKRRGQRILGALYGIWIVFGVLAFVIAFRGEDFHGDDVSNAGSVGLALAGVFYLGVAYGVLSGRLWAGNEKEGA